MKIEKITIEINRADAEAFSSFSRLYEINVPTGQRDRRVVRSTGESMDSVDYLRVAKILDVMESLL